MNKRKLLKYGVVALALTSLAMPLLAMGAAYDESGLPVDCDPNNFWCSLSLGSIETMLKFIAKSLIAIGIVFAIISIVWGGIIYMYAGDNEDMTKKAKSRIFNGIIGAAVVLGVGVILQLVARVVGGGFFSQ